MRPIKINTEGLLIEVRSKKGDLSLGLGQRPQWKTGGTEARTTESRVECGGWSVTRVRRLTVSMGIRDKDNCGTRRGKEMYMGQ